SPAIEGVLSAWLNQLPETQGVSLGPWDRVRIDQCAGRRGRAGGAGASRRALDPGPIAWRQIRLRAEYRPGRRIPEARRKCRASTVAGAARRADAAFHRCG